MKTLLLPGVIAAIFLIIPCSLASAAEVAMTRVLFCENDDAKMEVYVPQANISGSGVANAKLAKPVIGYYALDLTNAGERQAARTGACKPQRGQDGPNRQPVHPQFATHAHPCRRWHRRFRQALRRESKMPRFQ